MTPPSPVDTWGYVYARCPECGHKNRILVTIPAHNKPFKPTTYECQCGTHFRVTDPHKYDINGNVL